MQLLNEQSEEGLGKASKRANKLQHELDLIIILVLLYLAAWIKKKIYFHKYPSWQKLF